MRRLWIAVGIGAIVAPFVIFVGASLHYEQVTRPENLRAAGPLPLERMDTALPPETVLPPEPGGENAAPYYLAALNSYNARRLPYLKNRKLNPFANEPSINAAELAAVQMGARQRECDFYATVDGNPTKPRFTLILQPSGREWPFDIVEDPYALRPYVSVIRLVAQALLNEGKRQERAHHLPEAERAFQTITRFGEHLRQHPGSLMDLQIGLELEMKGLHYLDAYYRLTNNSTKRGQCWKYGDAVNRLLAEVVHKYTLLGNPEAAKQIVLHDRERVWRIVAAAALRAMQLYGGIGWLEGRSIHRTLAAAQKDNERAVRRAVLFLETHQPPKPPATKQKNGEGDIGV